MWLNVVGATCVIINKMAATNENGSELEKKLFESIDKNDVELLKNVLSQGQKVNICDGNFMTPLQNACYKGNKDIVQILIDQVKNTY